jgi:hypothetical protein
MEPYLIFKLEKKVSLRNFVITIPQLIFYCLMHTELDNVHIPYEALFLEHVKTRTFLRSRIWLGQLYKVEIVGILTYLFLHKNGYTDFHQIWHAYTLRPERRNGSVKTPRSDLS